jgi:hypothetical protein
MESNRLAQPPLDAIAFDRPAQDLPHGQSDAKPAGRLPQQIKNGHMGSLVAAALLVYPLEIRVPE